jgi:hypothetical protein
MNNSQEITKFEFLLTLEGKFICQRFFNVKGHNPDTRCSVELHDYVKYICTQISEDLKTKSSSFIYENMEYILNSENVEDYSDKKNEHFLIEIKLGDDVFIQRIFPAYYYHPKVRYTVDVRPRLKTILSDLTEILSYDDVETTYLGYDLKK